MKLWGTRNMKTGIAIGLAMVFAAICIAAPEQQSSPDKTPRDVYGTPVPTGKLGHPIGTYLKIEGVRAEEGKVGVNTLAVDKVNGKTLDQPIGIWIDNVDALPKGERCVLVGYESGKWIGTPPDVIKNLGDVAVAQAPWHFYRFFRVIRVEEPKELQVQFPTSRIQRPRADPPR